MTPPDRDRCPGCGAEDRFRPRGTCASDTHDPHPWHREPDTEKIEFTQAEIAAIIYTSQSPDEGLKEWHPAMVKLRAASKIKSDLVGYARHTPEEAEFAEKLAVLEGHDPEDRNRFLSIARSALKAGAKAPAPVSDRDTGEGMDAAVEAAIEGLRSVERGMHVNDVGARRRQDAEAAVEAARPHLVKAERDRIITELERIPTHGAHGLARPAKAAIGDALSVVNPPTFPEKRTDAASPARSVTSNGGNRGTHRK